MLHEYQCLINGIDILEENQTITSDPRTYKRIIYALGHSQIDISIKIPVI